MRRSGFKGLVAAGIAATGMLASTTQVAANDIFLKLTGIPGESQDDKHKNEIDVLSWSWGQSDGTAVGKNGKFSPACIQDVHLVKQLDTASPGLIMAGVLGQVIPDAVRRRVGPFELEPEPGEALLEHGGHRIDAVDVAGEGVDPHPPLEGLEHLVLGARDRRARPVDRRSHRGAV